MEIANLLYMLDKILRIYFELNLELNQNWNYFFWLLELFRFGFGFGEIFRKNNNIH